MTEVNELLQERKRDNTESITTRCGSEVRDVASAFTSEQAKRASIFGEEEERRSKRAFAKAEAREYEVHYDDASITPSQHDQLFAGYWWREQVRFGWRENGVPAKVVGALHRGFVGKRRSNRTGGVFARAETERVRFGSTKDAFAFFL